MISRRLPQLDSGIVEGMIDSIISVVRNQLALGSQEEIRAELERFKNFTGYEFKEFQAGKLSSKQLNDTFQEILITLSGLYHHLNLSGQTIKNHSALSNSDLATLKQSITKLLENITIYKTLKLNSSVNNMKLISFRDGRNLSVLDTKAVVNTRDHKLTLKPITKTNFGSRAGVFKPTATVTYLSSDLETFKNTNAKPENALDPDPNTFWAETLLTDRPIVSEYNSVTYNGLGVSLVIDFKQMELVNTIEALPFSLFPTTILDVQSSTDGVTYTTIPTFASVSVGVNWYVLRFAPIVTRYVKLTLLQENYKSQIYNIPKSIAKNNNLFNSIADETLRTYETITSDIETRLADYDTDTKRVLDNLYKLNTFYKDLVKPRSGVSVSENLTVDLAPVLKDTGVNIGYVNAPIENDDIIQYLKYEYIVGLSHFEASFIQYESSSFYTSPLYQVDGTLYDLHIDPTSTIPTTTATIGTIPTNTIEYEIEIAPYRTHPIVPYNDTTIHEVIAVNRETRKAVVRFNASAITALYRNAIIIPEDSYSYDSATKTITIDIDYFNASSIYSASYTPTSAQNVLDVRSVFNSFPIPKPERFVGTDGNARLQLSTAPFVNYDIISDQTKFYRTGIDAVYLFKRSTAQEFYDGKVYGSFDTTLTTDSTTSITLASVTGLYVPEDGYPGKLRIDDEIMSYTTITGNVVSGLVRGIDGTRATTHTAASIVYSVANVSYVPITVLVDGIKARNITDYEAGLHPAFSANNSNTMVYDYIHAGNKLYFSSVITNKTIEVKYDILAQYIKLNAVLKSTIAGQRGFTPELEQIKIMLNMADI